MTAWQCGGQGFESPQLHPFDSGRTPARESGLSRGRSGRRAAPAPGRAAARPVGPGCSPGCPPRQRGGRRPARWPPGCAGAHRRVVPSPDCSRRSLGRCVRRRAAGVARGAAPGGEVRVEHRAGDPAGVGDVTETGSGPVRQHVEAGGEDGLPVAHRIGTSARRALRLHRVLVLPHWRLDRPDRCLLRVRRCRSPPPQPRRSSAGSPPTLTASATRSWRRWSRPASPYPPGRATCHPGPSGTWSSTCSLSYSWATHDDRRAGGRLLVLTRRVRPGRDEALVPER
jgi:hypothetical protein